MNSTSKYTLELRNNQTNRTSIIGADKLEDFLIPHPLTKDTPVKKLLKQIARDEPTSK